MTVTCRRATVEDVSALVALVRTFIQTTAYRKYVGDSPETIERTVRWMLSIDAAAIFVAHVPDGAIVGMLGVVEFSHPLSGALAASELFWWLDPAYRGWGGWLLRRAEKWAKSRGCQTIQMVAPDDKPLVQEMYRRVGYTAVELAFQKELS